MTRRSFLTAAFGAATARALPIERLCKGDRITISAINLLNPRYSELKFHPNALALIWPAIPTGHKPEIST